MLSRIYFELFTYSESKWASFRFDGTLSLQLLQNLLCIVRLRFVGFLQQLFGGNRVDKADPMAN